MTKTRTETDSFGPLDVPADKYFGAQTARSLMNFLSLRNAETAQREIRRYAEACERFLEQRMPVTYAAFVASGRVAP